VSHQKNIRIGIVGVGFGQHVHVPAFRSQPHYEVRAICASNQQRAMEVANRLSIPNAFGNWRELVEDDEIDAISIATPPALQGEIAMAALENRKSVFCEKPLCDSIDKAEALLKKAEVCGAAHMVDFIFPEIAEWAKAKQLLEAGVLGRVRHFTVSWQIETYAEHMGLDSWKTRLVEGGGTLNLFVSHIFYYLEWLFGPIAGLSCHMFGSRTSFSSLTVEFQSGASGSICVNSNAFLGSGHNLEIYGEDGTLFLQNPSSDYVRGFQLRLGTRISKQLQQIELLSPTSTYSDGRVAMVSQLVRRFLSWIETHQPQHPNMKDGLRVQRLLEAARRSNQSSCWIKEPF